MTNYSDFMLNELAGMSGLDFDQTSEVLQLLDEPITSEHEGLSDSHE